MATKTTGYTFDEFKSRRAHSTCLGTSEMYQLFDTAEFVDRFTGLNENLTVWDSISGGIA